MDVRMLMLTAVVGMCVDVLDVLVGVPVVGMGMCRAGVAVLVGVHGLVGVVGHVDPFVIIRSPGFGFDPVIIRLPRPDRPAAAQGRRDDDAGPRDLRVLR